MDDGITATITLCDGSVVLFDAVDLPLVTSYQWHLAAAGYVQTSTSVAGKRGCLWLHRLITGATKGEEVDHKDRDPLNNRRSNLRVVPRWVNSLNQGLRANRSGYKGVHFTRSDLRRPWRASSTDGYRNVHLGYFATPEEAAIAASQHRAERLRRAGFEVFLGETGLPLATAGSEPMPTLRLVAPEGA